MHRKGVLLYSEANADDVLSFEEARGVVAIQMFGMSQGVSPQEDAGESYDFTTCERETST